jgi:glycosyltransferase involved in cell wall biosynthesis
MGDESRVSAGPRFSVVIPVFNGATTIGHALETVLTQTYPAHEIIVIDDGSSDHTEEVVRAYGDSVRYVRQANAGPSTARNHGVQLAHGEWIAFLDADDWYYPDRLRLHAELILQEPDLDFLIGNFDYRDAEGGLMHSSMSASTPGRELLQAYGEMGAAVIGPRGIGDYIAEQFSDTRTLSVPRQTFLALGGFPTALRICEDVVFLLRLCARSDRAGVTCLPGAVYSVHNRGLIRSDRLRAQTETMRALRTLDDEMAQAPEAVRDAWHLLVKRAHHNLAYFLAKHGQRGAAVKSMLQSFLFRPAMMDIKALVAILRG